jgi:cell division septum initiation protein DivIVA
MNPDMTPGPSDGQEPIEQLFRDVFGLAAETARRITDADVDARLDQLLRKTGHASQPAPEPDPASILDAARRQAGEIVATAQRAAAETAAEAACAAQSVQEEASRAAGRIIAKAEEYSDTALGQAAAIIAEARSQADAIITEARQEAAQIVADARLRPVHAPSQELQQALTGTLAVDRYDYWTPVTALAAMWFPTRGSETAEFLYRAAAGPEPADPHHQLPWLQITQAPLCDEAIRETSGPPVAKLTRAASQDREAPGLLRRIIRSLRLAHQSRIATLDVPAGCLVVARADGIVTKIHMTRIPDDDIHIRDLRVMVLKDWYQPETTQEEQPASQDGQLAGIRGNRPARSIESSCY